MENIFCQLVTPTNAENNESTTSISNNNAHLSSGSNVQLNFSIYNIDGIERLVMFQVEANGHGQKEVLGMVGEYLEPYHLL